MAEPLKNQFLQKPFFESLGNQIRKVYPAWSQEKCFGLLYNDEWENLELKQRMKHAAFVLKECLPQSYTASIVILKQVSHYFSGFDGLVFSEFVQHHGLNELTISLDALEQFTQAGSAEFAIRPFILQHEEETMKHMLGWSRHENVHVRRLASEGCRPRLPWAPALPQFKKDPTKVLGILKNLKSDPELYVRKSVANNLNDIAKDHPDEVIRVTQEWNKNASENTRWIIRQALRSLIKDGHPGALAVLGFKATKAEIKNLAIPQRVQMGDKFKIAFDLVNLEKQTCDLLVDYIVFHQKANGSLTPKVFKIGTYTLEADETKSFEKQHSIIPITTRKYYPGEHRVALQVNGKILAEQPFTLNID